MMTFLRKHRHWVMILGCLATFVGVYSAFSLPETWRRADALAREPQRITLEELAERGPGDNPHVTVTDFTLGGDYVFSIQTRKGAPPPEPDQVGQGQAWIPLFPKLPPDDPEAPPPTGFVVLLETAETLASGTGFHLLSRRPSLNGLAIPASQRDIPADVQVKLEESYPDSDFENCLVLQQYEPHDKEDAPLFAAAVAVATFGGLLVGVPSLVLGTILCRGRPEQDRPPGTTN